MFSLEKNAFECYRIKQYISHFLSSLVKNIIQTAVCHQELFVINQYEQKSFLIENKNMGPSENTENDS